MNKILGLIVLLSVSLANASEPVGGCRVKTESFQANSLLVNNAGCVITRTNTDAVTEYLMVRVDKSVKDKGWGFPGGRPSSSKNDTKKNDDCAFRYPTANKIPGNVGFEYVEPAVCTASREAREELGFEVVIGDLILNQEKFATFHCYATQPEALTGVITAQDKVEIKEIGWFTREQASVEGFLRFADNLDIIDLVEKK